MIAMGCVWEQRSGGPVRKFFPATSCDFRRGEKLRRGATATTALAHITIAEKLDGRAADWLEQVTDAQYSP